MEISRRSIATYFAVLGLCGTLSVTASFLSRARAAAWSPTMKKAPAACRYEDRSIDKRCDSSNDCVMVEEVQDCCGSTLHIGVSASGKASFDKKPQKDLGCQPISCVVRWLRAEDCGESSNGKITVSCEKPGASGQGLCMTHIESKRR